MRETKNQVVDINSHVAELLNTPVQNLNLSVRAINVLNVIGISTFGEIPKINAAVTLLNVRNSGRKTVHDIEVFIGKFGLQLGMAYSEIVNTLMNVDLSKISHFLK